MTVNRSKDVVFIDLYGTLLHERLDQVSVGDFLLRHDSPLPESLHMTFWAETGAHDHAVISRSEDTYASAVRARRTELLVVHGASLPRAKAIVEEFEQWERTLSMEPYSEVLLTLEELGRMGLRRVVASNWHWDIDRVLADSGVAELVDGVAGSGQIGYRKPNPAFYRAALQIAGRPPEACLFVGDNWYDDVEGPMRHDIAAVHLHRTSDSIHFIFHRGPEVTRVRRIATLDALVDLLS